MHNEPVSVRKSLVAVVLLLLVSSILLACLLASAWKTKKENERQPMGPIKTHPDMSPRKQKVNQLAVTEKVSPIIRDQGASFSMLPSKTSAPAPFLSEAELKQKQSVRR